MASRSQSEFTSTLAFLNPSWAERIRKQEEEEKKRVFEQLLKTGPVDWDDMSTPFDKEVLVRAKTYNPPVLFDLPPWKPGKSGISGGLASESAKKHTVMCPGSSFGYMNMTLPRGESLKISSGHKRGRVWFDGPVNIPCLFEVQPDGDTETWMSFTPSEIYTQRSAVRMATGRVVVGGMGLGWLLAAVAARKSVTEVVLVEKNRPLADWLLPRIRATFPSITDAKLTVHVEDVYDFMERDFANGNHERTKYLLDIWSSYGQTDRKFNQWKDKLDNRLWGWGQLAEKPRRLW